MTILSFRNLGNTCYVNSILQNIIYDNSFKEKILNLQNDDEFIIQLQKLINNTTNDDEIYDYNLKDFFYKFII